MGAIVLIFGVPMIVAAALISPSALHNLTHGLLFYAIVGLGLPFVGWQTFLAVFAFPPTGTRRVAAVLNLWLGGAVLVAAVFNLVMAMADYSPLRPGPNPTAGCCWPGSSFACSCPVGFGAHCHRSCRQRLRLVERW